VPDLIRLFLDEEPILPNVPTFRCGDPEERQYVLDHIEELVVKPANESGGYGVVIGGRAGSEALELVKRRIASFPAGWVAQPTLALSTVPTLCDGSLAPRHVDLRPFVLFGPGGSYVTKGGLTRVALQPGSLIVNSSQGGGSKDTWVVDAATIPGASSSFVALGSHQGVPAGEQTRPPGRRATPAMATRRPAAPQGGGRVEMAQ
jgi:uncharacterized circularly permuted ATP-grasp superfamily protein